jgi:hypothetical protein
MFGKLMATAAALLTLAPAPAPAGPASCPVELPGMTQRVPEQDARWFRAGYAVRAAQGMLHYVEAEQEARALALVELAPAREALAAEGGAAMIGAITAELTCEGGSAELAFGLLEFVYEQLPERLDGRAETARLAALGRPARLWRPYV